MGALFDPAAGEILDGPRQFVRIVTEVIGGAGEIALDDLDALRHQRGAIMQNDTSIENLRAMTDAASAFGLSKDDPDMTDLPPADVPASVTDRPSLRGIEGFSRGTRTPGTSIPWAEKAAELPPLQGDEAIVRQVWEEVDSAAYDFIWQMLLSF